MPESHSEDIGTEPASSENILEKMRFDRFIDTKTAVDTHGEPIAVDTHGEIEISNESHDDESTISIKVFIMTNTGQKTYHDFHKVIQWTEQAHPNKLTPQLELDSVPSVDKEYLYNMVKQKFENDANTDYVDILLEATYENSVIVRTKYIGCEIDQYWLNTENNGIRQSLESVNLELYEQFFFKCHDYSVNSGF